MGGKRKERARERIAVLQHFLGENDVNVAVSRDMEMHAWLYHSLIHPS
jgi:hypothetical protein